MIESVIVRRKEAFNKVIIKEIHVKENQKGYMVKSCHYLSDLFKACLFSLVSEIIYQIL